MTDPIQKAAEEIIDELNGYARRVDRYDYGLPVYSDDARTEMVDIIRAILDPILAST